MRKNLFYSTMMLTAANLLLRCISMAFQVYLAGRVGASGIGLLQLILTVSAMAVTVGTSGIRVAGMYLCAEELGHRRPGGVRKTMTACLFYALAASTLSGLVLIRFSDSLASGWIGDPRAAASLRLTGVFLPFTCLSTVMSGYFTAASKVGRLVLVDIAERLLSIFLTFALLQGWAGDDLSRSCCAIVGGNNIATAAGFFLLYGLYLLDRRKMTPTKELLHLPSRLAKLCVPLAFNEYLRSGLGTLEQLLIPKGLAKAGSSYETSMAAYGTIHGMVFPIIYFPTAVLYSLSDLLVPELAKCMAQENRSRIRHLTDQCLRLSLFYACAIAGGLYCLSDPLGQLLFQSDSVGLYLRLFAPLVLMLYLDAIVDGMNKGLGQQVICVRYNTLTSTLDVILLFLLLPKYGIGGYYFSFVVTHAINFYLSIRRLIKVSAYRPPLAFLGKAAVSSAAACLLTLLAPADGKLTGVLLSAALFLTLFFGLSAALHTLSREDVHYLRHLIFPRRKPKKED